MIGTENLGGTMMGDCNHCSGSCEKCSGCGGCGGALELTEGEVAVLERLSQIPFLPAARKPDEMTPFYLEDELYSKDQYSAILLHLEKKRLISIDYDQPLKSYTQEWYLSLPVRGSFGLTQRGQQVVELLQLQGLG